MPHMGADRSELAQPMHSLDVRSELACVPTGAEVSDRLAGREPCAPAVVDAHTVGRYRGEFVPVKCRVATRDDRPRVRVGGCLAGEVARIEFGDGRVEVVEVER